MNDSSYYRYWGKARPAADSSAGFHLLPFHCLDVAAVGVEALQRMPSLRALMTQRLGLEPAALERWLAFWLCLHDLGKFAESFQSQCPEVFIALRGRPPDAAKRYTLRHDSLGMLFWKGQGLVRDQIIDAAWFGQQSEDLADGLDWWARAVTGHHGQPPEEGDSWLQHFDRIEDRAAALEFVSDMREMFIGDEIAQTISRQDPSTFLAASLELSWWLAGVAVLADWLGSNTNFFPYEDRPQALAGYWPKACTRAARAIDARSVGGRRRCSDELA